MLVALMTWSRAVVLYERLPRIIAALIIGSTLSLGGVAYQSVFRNPLVSPGLLGVWAGAGFGMAISILSGALEFVRILLTFAGGGGAFGVHPDRDSVLDGPRNCAMAIKRTERTRPKRMRPNQLIRTARVPSFPTSRKK